MFKIDNKDTGTMELFVRSVNGFQLLTNVTEDSVVLAFLLLILKYFTSFSSVSIVGFEQVNVRWVLISNRKSCIKYLKEQQ